MAPWQRRVGALACSGLLSVGSLPARAVPVTPTTPSPELLAAYRALDRLMASARVEAPITLVVRPFGVGSCAPPPAPTAARPEDVLCLQGFQLPPLLRQGFFVPFVVDLERQSHPEQDPQQLAAAVEGRTILLNASGLERMVPRSPLPSLSASPASQRLETGGTLPPVALCRLSEAFAALQLDQPRQRRQHFDRIHTRLAERIHSITGNRQKGWSFVELLAFNLVTLGYFIPYGIETYLEGIPSQNRGNWVNARLAESPHWQVLQVQAPMVATALQALRGLPEDASSMFSIPTSPPSFKQTWGRIDGWFGIAAQEQQEVMQELRLQAQAEALRRLAAAGIDPGICAGEFLPATVSETEAAQLRLQAQARSRAAAAGPGLPHQLLPDGQTVVIFPKPVPR